MVEVLSPSGVKIDMREKAEDDLDLPTLLAYVVGSQDEPLLWVWARNADGLFPKEPVPVVGGGERLVLPLLKKLDSAERALRQGHRRVAEKLLERLGYQLRNVLGEVVAARQRLAAHVLGPLAPQRQRVEAALDGAGRAPQRE